MRVLLVNESDREREMLADRLRAQGYQVDVAADAATGADMALVAPPDGVVADLWMRSISGVPLCHLLRSEPSTNDIPVVLCAEDEPRNRFWAERAGAAFVRKGRVGELVRTLARELRELKGCEGLVRLDRDDGDVRDRIARHLDAALFDSVLVSEVRALANSASVARLFDLLAQLLAQVTSYRWLALSTQEPEQVGIHVNPSCVEDCVSEVRDALSLSDAAGLTLVEDEDASADAGGGPPIVREVRVGSLHIGSIALAPCREHGDGESERLLDVVSSELGGPLRMTLLVEESRRLATTDPLTGLYNRRAFMDSLSPHLPPAGRVGQLALLLFDVDHFKRINDTHGHAGGDLVLAAVGKMLSGFVRGHDLAARWGGEEFVVALPHTNHEQGLGIAERLRRTLEDLIVHDLEGRPIPVTASFGVAVLRPGDDVDDLVQRADACMYLAKSQGRNRVAVDPVL